MRRNPVRAALIAASSLAMLSSAHAGGFDRVGGVVGLDLLFSPDSVATEAGVTYVSPQRTLKNVQRGFSATNPPTGSGLPPPLRSPPLRSDSVEVGSDYAVPRFAAKVNLWEPMDCLASYSKPYGADADYGENNAYSITATRFEVDSDEYALTCAYKFAAGKGFFRAIGGIVYQEIDAFLARQTLLDFGNEGVGEFNLSDSAWSYRAGAAYEMPDIALRASLIYTGRFDYDLEGQVDTTGFGATGAPIRPPIPAAALQLFTGVFDVDAQTEIPQSFEFRLQSGIAPDTIAFGSIRWQDWSKLQSIAINGVISPRSAPGPIPAAAPNNNVSFDAFYEDGWTVSVGVGRKFSETLSGLASFTWDKGTSTTLGFQSDSYAVALGGAYTPNKNVELRLGGSVGVLTGGRSNFTLGEGDPANAVSYEYDADLVVGGTASVRVKF